MKTTRTALALGLSLLAATASAQGCMATIQKSGLNIGTSPDYPPYESLDTSNKVVGFDIDLLDAIGKQMGVKVNVIGQSFDGLIPALLARKIDMIAAGMTITEERKKSVNFSLPYFSGQNVIVVRKENSATKTLAALGGKSIAVQIGSAQEKLAQGVKGGNVKSYNLYTDAALAVQTRQADSMIVARPVALQFVKTYPDLTITGMLNKIDTGLAIRKDCTDVQNRVNAAIIQLRKSGEMDALVAKWFK